MNFIDSYAKPFHHCSAADSLTERYGHMFLSCDYKMKHVAGPNSYEVLLSGEQGIFQEKTSFSFYIFISKWIGCCLTWKLVLVSCTSSSSCVVPSLLQNSNVMCGLELGKATILFSQDDASFQSHTWWYTRLGLACVERGNQSLQIIRQCTAAKSCA